MPDPNGHSVQQLSEKLNPYAKVRFTHQVVWLPRCMSGAWPSVCPILIVAYPVVCGSQPASPGMGIRKPCPLDYEQDYHQAET